MHVVEAGEKPMSMARFSLSLPNRQNELLDDMVKSTGMTKNELLRQAIGILSIVIKAREKGLTLALADEDNDQIKQRIVSTI
jgi:hypothetical protein